MKVAHIDFVILLAQKRRQMARRNKLEKFAELRTFPHVYENFDMKEPRLFRQGHPVQMRGRWHAHFGNSHPITLELACGRGEYAVGLARMYPQRNFIGVDIKGARMWKGARIALEEGLANVAFLRTRIELIDHFFEAGEVEEIWITFPDPFLRKSKANRRLTSPRFLERYHRILAAGGLVHLKTDEPLLYDFTLEVLADDPHFALEYCAADIYAGPLPVPELALKTYYERMHLAAGKTIKYVRMRRKG